MQELSPSSRFVATPQQPVDDREREELGQRLNDAYASGKVGVEEYRALLDQLYAAQTLGQLVPVVRVLPAKSTHVVPDGIVSGAAEPGVLEPARTVGLPAVRPGPGALFVVGGLIIAVAAIVALLISLLI